MSVLWNNSSVGSFTHIHTLGEQHNNLRWADQSIIVVGTGSDKLTFLSTGGTNDAGPMIDDVTITAIVPEPSTGVLSCLGVVSLLIRRRH